MQQDPFDQWMSQLAVEEPLRRTTGGLDAWMSRRRRTLYRRSLCLSLVAVVILATTLMACTPSPDGVAINRSSLLKKAEVCQTLSATLSRHENL